MRRVLSCLAVLVALLGPSASARAQGGEHVTHVVKIDGVIDGRVTDLIERRLEDAGDGSLVILQIDSPGTLGVDVQRLAELIAVSHVPVVVWAGPPGSLLQGGAVLLLEAAHIAVTSPRSGIGPGLPIDLGNEPRQAEVDPAEAAADYAQERDRSAAAVADLFEPGAVALTPQQSLDLRVVDRVAQSIPALLNDLDGETVETLAGPQRLVTEGPPGTFALRFSELGPIERILHAVASPTLSYLLLVLGLWGLVFELVQPGFGLAGFAGVAFLGLAVYSFVVLPVSWLGLALLVAGVALFTLDVRLRKLSVLSVLGTAAFAFGSFMLYRDVAPAIAVSPWVIWTFVAGSVAYFGFALTAAIRAREDATAQRQSGLVGLVGETVGDLAPDGQIVVKGAMWQGRALTGEIPGGTRVRVRRVEGLVLEVTAEGNGNSDHG